MKIQSFTDTGRVRDMNQDAFKYLTAGNILINKGLYKALKKARFGIFNRQKPKPGSLLLNAILGKDFLILEKCALE